MCLLVLFIGGRILLYGVDARCPQACWRLRARFTQLLGVVGTGWLHSAELFPTTCHQLKKAALLQPRSLPEEAQQPSVGSVEVFVGLERNSSPSSLVSAPFLSTELWRLPSPMPSQSLLLLWHLRRWLWEWSGGADPAGHRR